MPSLSDVQSQIAGVRKTKQITKAMGMVASVNLRTVQGRYDRFTPYAQKFEEMLDTLSANVQEVEHPLLMERQDPKTALILLFTSDKGLCGAFNANIISEALKFAKILEDEGKKVSFVCVGRKGFDVIKKRYSVYAEYINIMNHFDFALAVRLANLLTHAFTSGETDEAHIVYSEFQSLSRQVPKSTQVLPIAPHESKDALEKNEQSNYIFEPDAKTLLAELLPKFLNVQVYQALLDLNVGKSAARMIAMNNATSNCDELIVSLTLLFNRARQAAITNDLIDIVGGANALQSQ